MVIFSKTGDVVALGLGGNGIFSITSCKVFGVGSVASVVFLENKVVCWEFEAANWHGVSFELEELEVGVVFGGEEAEEGVGVLSDGLLMVHSCAFVFFKFRFLGCFIFVIVFGFCFVSVIVFSFCFVFVIICSLHVIFIVATVISITSIIIFIVIVIIIFVNMF